MERGGGVGWGWTAGDDDSVSDDVELLCSTGEETDEVFPNFPCG